MLSKLIYAAVFLEMIFPLFTTAQTYQQTSSGIKTVIGKTEIEVCFYAPSIVRIIKTPSGKFIKKQSLSVIKQPEKTVFSVQHSKEVVRLKSSILSVTVDLKSGVLGYESKVGQTLLKEKSGIPSLFSPFDDAGSKTQSVYQAFVLDKEEPIYGLGQNQRGNLNLRNQQYKNMIQGNTDDVVPFFQSIKGYGLFWDNYSPTTFIDKPDETSFRSDVGESIDYYFMYSGNADGVITQMRDLTGQAPMFPLWTFGFWQSKERYKSQQEVVSVVKKYRELGVPLDGIIQDWQYWGNNYLWNAMDFLNPEFPDPKKLIKDVHDMNAHMIISIWASFGPHTQQYRELNQKGMLLNFATWPESGLEQWPPNLNYPSGVRVYDAYNPEARDIFWKYANKGLFSIGIDGWWMDSTEPDHLSFKPEDLDNKTHLGSFRKVRNAFPLMTVGGMYDHQRASTSSKRVFILTRSAFAGQQRYGANTWSGDITSSWQTLKNQIPAGLNFSLSGIPYWNSDIGGFFLSQFKRKLEDPEYRELYARWMEFGAFCPMMRSHGADAPREIYQFGKKGDKVYDAAEKFIDLRYRMLPYIYSTSWEVTKHQYSMMRALFMDFAADKNVWDNTTEFMFGKSFLVNPVTQAMYVKQEKNLDKNSINIEDFSTVKSQKTYLPKNTVWYDFWTGKKFNGGQIVSSPTPLDIIPLFVKAGAIIPWGPKVQFAEEKKWDHLEIRIYPGADGDFTLYEDEKDNYNYEKGKYSEIKFHWDDKVQVLSIQDRKGSYDGMLNQRSFSVVIVPAGINDESKPAKTVIFKGKKISIKL